MFAFGAKALEQFVDRLVEWPQYCNHILQISHLRGTHAELVAFIERALARISSGQSESNGSNNAPTDHHQGSTQPSTTENLEVWMINELHHQRLWSRSLVSNVYWWLCHWLLKEKWYCWLILPYDTVGHVRLRFCFPVVDAGLLGPYFCRMNERLMFSDAGIILKYGCAEVWLVQGEFFPYPELVHPTWIVT